MKYKDLTGQKFGRLMAVKYVSTTKAKKAIWLCRCDCGNERNCISGNLVSGISKSCGCYEKDLKTTHGMWRTPEYRAWQDMKDRCSNRNNKFYPSYGGRGIKVCDRWQKSFQNFYNDLGARPSNKHSLDRIDVNSGYHPENTRWALNIVQQRNRRDNHFIETEWGCITIAEAAEKSGLTKETIQGRIRLGWPEQKLLIPHNRPLKAEAYETTYYKKD